MLITEELFLLLRRDDGRAESAAAQNGYALAGAVVTDLILAERITLTEEKNPRVHVLPGDPTGHPALDQALQRLGERNGKRLSGLVTDRRLNVEEPTALVLAHHRIIGIEPKRGLGLIPAKYPVLDPRPEAETRERLRAVLAGAEQPSVPDSALLSILQGVDLAHRVLKAESGGLAKRHLKQRIEAVAQQVPTGTAVAKAVQAMNTAMMTAIIVPAVVAGS
ncbi:GPP34 family phosphoprotein [Alteromonas gracilis]